MQQHRHQEFIRFPNRIERAVPAGKVIHFTLTSCSWLNAVESLFAKLAERQLKRGVFSTVVALQEAIRHFVVTTTTQPRP